MFKREWEAGVAQSVDYRRIVSITGGEKETSRLAVGPT